MSEQPTNNPVVDATPNTVPTIPDDWAALGTNAGYNPKPAEALRMFVVGPSGEGKTTFMASIPRNHILDFEKGADACTGSRSHYTAVKDYSHLMALKDKFILDSKNGSRHWDRITVDTIDELIAMIKHQLEEEKLVEDITDYRSEGYGYNLIMQRFWSIVLDLEQAGYTWAFGGHIKTKTETNPVTKKSETKIRESVYPGIAGKIKAQCDFKLTIYCLPETIVEEGPPRKLPSGQSIPGKKTEVTRKVYYVDSFTTDARDSKQRGVPSMDVKFEIPLVNAWDLFKEKYDSAVEVERKKYQS
jgi:hypothetical protein